MKVIIAGGRDYTFNVDDIKLLTDLYHRHGFTKIITGGATGADECGKYFAEKNGINHQEIKTDWDTLGKKAGPLRNKKMAVIADAVILFPGGRGTESMRKIAREYFLKVLYDAQNNLQ